MIKNNFHPTQEEIDEGFRQLDEMTIEECVEFVKKLIQVKKNERNEIKSQGLQR